METLNSPNPPNLDPQKSQSKKLIIAIIVIILLIGGIGTAYYFNLIPNIGGQGLLKKKDFKIVEPTISITPITPAPDAPFTGECAPNGATDRALVYNETGSGPAGTYVTYNDFFNGLLSEINLNNSQSKCPYLITVYNDSMHTDLKIICKNFTIAANNVQIACTQNIENIQSNELRILNSNTWNSRLNYILRIDTDSTVISISEYYNKLQVDRVAPDYTIQ